MRRFLLGLLLPSVALAQSVPNGTIIQNQVWTPAQWNSAWQSKVDGTGGTCAGCTLSSPTVTGGSITGGSIAGATGAFTTLNASGSIYTAITNAVGDGVTDDTSAINTFLSGLTSGSTVILQPGKNYLINSANVTVPAGVRIIGAVSPTVPSKMYSFLNTTGFIVNPSYTINLGEGAQIENLFIRATGLTANPTAAQAISAVTAWGASGGIGVTIPANTGGTAIRNSMFVGFKTAIRAYAGQFVLRDLWIDSYNGVEVSQAGDNHTLDNVRIEPFYSLATSSSSGSWARPGIAFYLHDGNTGSILNNVFSFMWATGLLFSNTGVAPVIGSGFEWQSSSGNGITNTVGIRWVGHNSATSVHATYVSGYDTPLSDEGGGEVVMRGLSVVSASVTGIYLGGTTATPGTVTIGGTPAAGNTVTLTLTSSAITGSPWSTTYTVAAADTPTTIAAALVDRVLRAQSLMAARVFAQSSGAVATIYFPGSVTLTTGASSTGGTTTAISTGTAQAGSYGLIGDLDATFTNVPIITAGDSVGTTLSWVINAPFLSNGNLPSTWLSAPNSGEFKQIALAGIRWSDAPAVSACGTGAYSTGSDNAADIRTGGGTVTSCTVTFTTPFPWVPRNISVTPKTSAVAVAVTAANASTFTVTFASNFSASDFTYTVTP